MRFFVLPQRQRRNLRQLLSARRIPFTTTLPQRLTTGGITFIDVSDAVEHMDLDERLAARLQRHCRRPRAIPATANDRGREIYTCLAHPPNPIRLDNLPPISNRPGPNEIKLVGETLI